MLQIVVSDDFFYFVRCFGAVGGQWMMVNGPPYLVCVISEAVYAANHLTDANKNKQ